MKKTYHDKMVEWAIAQLEEIIRACDEERPCVMYGKPMTEEEEKEWSDKFFED